MGKRGWLFLTAGALLATMTTASAAQVCNEAVSSTTPDSRFIADGDGTVKDVGTGLQWKQCAEGLSGAGCTSGFLERFTWQEALRHAADAVFAGHDDWRLPNKNELASLVERRCYDPAINTRYFPNTPSVWFWSSSPGAGNSYDAWGVSFGGGYVYGYLKSYAGYVRLVRGGQ